MKTKTKIVFKLIIIFSIMIGNISCEKKEIIEDGLFLHAKVENASKYNNVVEVRLMMNVRDYGKNIELARGNWKNGSFTIELPKTLDTNYLYALIDENRLQPTIIDTPSSLAISNINVKIWNAQFWGVDKDGNVVTPFFPFEIDKDGNNKGIFYTYVDSDVTISGRTEREGVMIDTEFHNEKFIGSHPHPIWYNKITTTYSVEWKEGWNIWSYSRFFLQEEPVEKWSIIPFSKLKWYGGEDLQNVNF
jgi:hypothetical protein